MFVTPTESPVTTPVAGTTEPITGKELDQVPPPPAEYKVVAVPGQIEVVPVIAAGKGFTVMTEVATQPVGISV